MNFLSSLPLIALTLVGGTLLDRCSGSDTTTALGILAYDRVALTATANEIIVDLPIAEGTPVSKGSVLVVLDAKVQTAELELAKARLEEAEANLLKQEAGPREEEIAMARAKVAGAQARLADAEAMYARNAKLVENEVVTEARLEQDLAARGTAQADLDSALESLRELENGTRPEDLAVARANVRAAEATVKAQQDVLDDLTVVATRDGILDSLPWNLGERVTQGSPVAILITGTTPYARIYVPEPYRIKISAGDTLSVHIDGLDDPLEGTVRWISEDASFTPYYGLSEDNRARLVYRAEIDLPASAEGLPSGVPVQVAMP